jgi:hypothetical protein
MTITKLLRGAACTAAALALAAPAAQASDGSVSVCNQASAQSQGGGLIALDASVDSPAVRYTDDLSTHPGRGEGITTAAAHSPALTVCGNAGPIDPPWGWTAN